MVRSGRAEGSVPEVGSRVDGLKVGEDDAMMCRFYLILCYGVRRVLRKDALSKKVDSG